MKSVSTVQTKKRLVSRTVKKTKRGATFSIFLSTTKNRKFCCLAAMAHFASSKRRVVTTKYKRHFLSWRNFSANHHQLHPNLSQKRQKTFPLWHNCVDFPLVDTFNQKFFSSPVFYTCSLHYSNLIFSVSNKGIEWSLNFVPHSVTLTVKDLVQEMTTSSQEIRNSFGSLELVVVSKTRLLNNHLVRVPVTPKQQGTHKLMDELLSSCRCTGYGHKRVSGVWSGLLWTLLGKWSTGCRRCFFIRHWCALFANSFWRLGDGTFSRKPQSARQIGGQRELSSNNTSFWETNITLCIAEKLPI